MRAMLAHAHTTEREEVMGLLVGLQQPSKLTTSSTSSTSSTTSSSPALPNHTHHTRVHRVHVLRREVKQRDRVEISPV
jgi:hypothetical protein